MGTLRVPVATQGLSQSEQQVIQGRLGDSEEKPLVRRGAGSFQRRKESKAGEGCEFTYGGTRGGYETASIRVSHIKVKRRD